MHVGFWEILWIVAQGMVAYHAISAGVRIAQWAFLKMDGLSYRNWMTTLDEL